MKVTIPGFVAPIAGARLEINGRVVFLRPRDKYPIFEAGAPELRGIEHLMGPLFVDFPAPVRAPRQPKGPAKPTTAAKAPAAADPLAQTADDGGTGPDPEQGDGSAGVDEAGDAEPPQEPGQ